MEARGIRSYYEDQKYNIANWRYHWLTRPLYQGNARRLFGGINYYDTDKPQEELPTIFPSNLAFLCSKESFNWSIELYNVTGEDENLSLDISNKIPVRVQGLGIPNPKDETLKFSEEYVPMRRQHPMDINNLNNGVKYWTQEEGILDREVEIEATTLGLEDMKEFYKQWEFRPHGRLLDMAVFVN
jgi:hypothetical protein